MAYVDIAELKRVLQKPTPTADELVQMQRALDEAAESIDWDLSYSVDDPPPAVDTPQYALLANVNLDRAVELWKSPFTPYGASVLAPDVGVVVSPRDTWYRHHLRLNPLRERYPIG